MKLIIGGAFQGKTQAALEMTGLNESDIIDGGICTLREIRALQGPAILNRFHELVRRSADIGAQEGGGPAGLEQMVSDGSLGAGDLTIICSELGCGVVPMEKADRMWRETTGRLLCELAKQAQEVYRVTAGIAVRIK